MNRSQFHIQPNTPPGSPVTQGREPSSPLLLTAITTSSCSSAIPDLMSLLGARPQLPPASSPNAFEKRRRVEILSPPFPTNPSNSLNLSVSSSPFNLLTPPRPILYRPLVVPMGFDTPSSSSSSSSRQPPVVERETRNKLQPGGLAQKSFEIAQKARGESFLHTFRGVPFTITKEEQLGGGNAEAHFHSAYEFTIKPPENLPIPDELQNCIVKHLQPAYFQRKGDRGVVLYMALMLLQYQEIKESGNIPHTSFVNFDPILQDPEFLSIYNDPNFLLAYKKGNVSSRMLEYVKRKFETSLLFVKKAEPVGPIGKNRQGTPIHKMFWSKGVRFEPSQPWKILRDSFVNAYRYTKEIWDPNTRQLLGTIRGLPLDLAERNLGKDATLFDLFELEESGENRFLPLISGHLKTFTDSPEVHRFFLEGFLGFIDMDSLGNIVNGLRDQIGNEGVAEILSQMKNSLTLADFKKLSQLTRPPQSGWSSDED